MNAAYRMEAVSFAYGGTTVLQIDALEITEGRITALVGPNGSGKTTLMNLMGFLEVPAAGRLLFLGAETPAELHPWLRRRVGFVHQKPYLFHASVRKNLELGLVWHGVAARERLRRVEQALRDFDLTSVSDRPAAQVSGGEAQRLALARALVLDPVILILDEPFSHLDGEARFRLQERLLRLRDERDKTVVFSTHDDHLARWLADEVRCLEGGRVLPAAGMNLFRGAVAGGYFDTGKLKIHVASLQQDTAIVGVGANEIVLSSAELESSMRNNFRGIVRALNEQGSLVEVTVDAGESFRVLVTRDSVREMALGVGSVVWLGFKSSAVQPC